MRIVQLNRHVKKRGKFVDIFINVPEKSLIVECKAPKQNLQYALSQACNYAFEILGQDDVVDQTDFIIISNGCDTKYYNYSGLGVRKTKRNWNEVDLITFRTSFYNHNDFLHNTEFLPDGIKCAFYMRNLQNYIKKIYPMLEEAATYARNLTSASKKYENFRLTLLSFDNLKIPQVFEKCEDINMFRHYLQNKGGYAERRKFLNKMIRDICDQSESSTTELFLLKN
jgi:hypothetical protein